MSTIVIKDLPDNVELDREAMRAITGGARSRSPGRVAGQSLFSSAGRIVSPTVRVTRLQPKTAAGKAPGK